MKCERDIIKYHLEAKHSMSLESYIKQFPNPVVTVGESRRSNASSAAQANPPMVQIFGDFDDTPAKSDVSQDGSKKSPWYRGSSFSCVPCNRNFTAQVGGNSGTFWGLSNKNPPLLHR